MVTVTLPPELEQVAVAEAQRLGVTPEDVVLNALRDKLPVRNTATTAQLAFEPQDEWERGLLSMGFHTGVSLSDEAVSSEGLYD
jgi:hypothetical protein